ncbi:hypothetical protein BTR23_24240 [Alkalihalophilus pseudofirmus]|nr:hypothetical protein BTR23_24240 [Alkalihalophilus pseudofirmus]
MLDCTDQNAKLIMKNMKELEWITWEVFKSQGKKPLLTFLFSKTEMEHLLKRKERKGSVPHSVNALPKWRQTLYHYHTIEVLEIHTIQQKELTLCNL